MHYFVDGYNLIFRSQQTDEALQRQRDRTIVDFVQKITLLELDITLVFDAACNPGLSTRQHVGPLEIVYTSSGETADAYILGELLLSKTPRRQTVITSDKPLAEHARRLGSKTMNVESFLAWIQARYRRRRQKFPKKALPTLAQMPVIAPTRRPSAKLPIMPAPAAPPSSPDDYLHIFEKRLKDLADNAPIKPPTSLTPFSSKKTRNPKPKSQATKAAPESDEDRWLRLFEDRLNSEAEGDKKT